MIRLQVVLVCASVLAAAPERHFSGSPKDVSVRARGGFLLQGGGGNVDEAFRWFLERAGKGDVVVLRSSGEDQMNRYLAGRGADSIETWVLRSPDDSHNPQVLASLRGAEAIFLAGGDQWNYIRLWKKSPIVDAIHAAAERGAAIGGTSAGLAVLGEHSFSAQRDTIKSPEALANPLDERITIESQFLRFPALNGVLTDSHFRERDRMGRLLVFLARAGGNARGIGIDEATAVIVDPDGAAQVVGAGSAYFIRGTKLTPIHDSRPLDGAEYDVVRVGPGDKFHLDKWMGEGLRYQLRVVAGKVHSSITANY